MSDDPHVFGNCDLFNNVGGFSLVHCFDPGSSGANWWALFGSS